MSLDGHDKLCGYQKAMFPLGVYGGKTHTIVASIFSRTWTLNNNPKVIGRFYLDYLYESRGRIIVITFLLKHISLHVQLKSSLRTADVFPVKPPKNNVCDLESRNDFRDVISFLPYSTNEIE